MKKSPDVDLPSGSDAPSWGRIRSFTRRGGRMVRQYERVLKEHSSHYVLQLPPGDAHTTIDPRIPVDLNEVFARQAPLVVEIGPGSGEQLISYALAHPERNILAFEAWNVAIARCVANASKAGVTNVRLIEADAAQALPAIFAWDHNPRAAEIWTFFPDPWRKSRHRKRRLVTKEFAADIYAALEEKGIWRLATDWDDYAWQMRDEVEASGLFLNLHHGERPDPNDPQPERGGFAPRWEERLMTRFEQRGLDAGRTIHDFTFEKKTVNDGERHMASVHVDPENKESLKKSQGFEAGTSHRGQHISDVTVGVYEGHEDQRKAEEAASAEEDGSFRG